MLRIMQMEPDDLERMAAVEPGMATVFEAGMPGDILARAGAAYTAFLDGKPVACAGLIAVHDSRAVAWAITSRCEKRVFARVHREIMRGLDQFPFRRIEAAVRADFTAGRRWLDRLGFACEAERLEAYLPDGRAAALYAKVRP